MYLREMYEISSDPLLLSIVQAYMGRPPIFNHSSSLLNSFASAKTTGRYLTPHSFIITKCIVLAL